MCLLSLLMLTGCFFDCFRTSGIEDFDTEVAALRVRELPNVFDQCRPQQPTVTGECDGGQILFISEALHHGSRTIFFDADTGRFLHITRLEARSFCIIPSPVALRCQNGTVTEVFCGDAEIGDSFSPY